MEEQPRTTSWALAIILVGYLLTASLYAWKTPRWQAPDEPAHFNYIVALAETGEAPVLRAGDYPANYLEEIKSRKFPPSMSVAPLRYEFYQPPLFYALGALIYRATGRWGPDIQFLALRLLSVLLGLLLLAVAYQIVRTVFPGDAVLALATTAFVGALPMHTAMMAAINPDTLAELWIALTLWLLLRRTDEGKHLRTWLAAGLVLGLGLLTKITVIIALAIVPVALWLRSRERTTSRHVARGGVRRRVLGGLVVIWGVAALIVAPWLVRNALVYGQKDVLGWSRHNAVVVGQPRTADWLARFGAQDTLQRFAVTTFHSFWGQFGWMGVPMSARAYDLLFVLSLLAIIGCDLYLWDIGEMSAVNRPPQLMTGLVTLGLTLLLAILLYLAYNLTYVQHQGRYLFPALVPIGAFFSLGLREMIAPRRWSLLAGLWVLSLFALDIYSLFGFILPQLR